MSKKEKRLESKKKKAIALLNLIETKAKVMEESEMEGSTAKKARLELTDAGTDNINGTSNSTTSDGAVQLPVPQVENSHSSSQNEITDDEYAKAKKLQREMQKSADEHGWKSSKNPARYGPKLHLCLENMLPFSPVKDKSRESLETRLPPLYTADVQHLLLLATLKNFSFWTPRWCRLNRPRKLNSVVLIALNDVSINDFESHSECFPFLCSSFMKCVEMVSPSQYNSCLERDLSSVPLFISQMKCYTKREDVRQRILQLISKPAKPHTSQVDSRKRMKGDEDDDTPAKRVKTNEANIPSADGDKPNKANKITSTETVVIRETTLESENEIKTDNTNITSTEIVKIGETTLESEDGIQTDKTDTASAEREKTNKAARNGVDSITSTEEVGTKDRDLQTQNETISCEKKELSYVEKRQQEAGYDDKFPRTSLLLSSTQLMEEGYPLPVTAKNNLYADYAFSKDSYLPVTPFSPLFAVDCEMCQTGERELELTRVSVVNEQGEVVYDQLVKPYNPITNYLTLYSGMTEERLAPVTKRVKDVHQNLKDLLPPDAILCGQSLWNDLNALKLFHPYVIDTSIIFNQSGDKKIRCGLRKLAFNFLGRKIQGSKAGHCSIEDAKATMDLVKLKLSKDIEFGDAMLGGVYFPNIKTYFENPAKAQNVDETFSSHPTPSATTTCTPLPTATPKAEEITSHFSPTPSTTSTPLPIPISAPNSSHPTSAPDSASSCKRTADISSQLSCVHSTVSQSQTAPKDKSSSSDSGSKPVTSEHRLAQRTNGLHQEVGTEQDRLAEGPKQRPTQSNIVSQETVAEHEEEKHLLTCNTQNNLDLNREDRGSERVTQYSEEKVRDVLLQQNTVDGKDDCGAHGVNQNAAFFQQKGGSLRFSFFELLADNGNSAGVAGSREVLGRFESERRLECVETGSDEEMCVRGLEVCRSKDFTWLHFSGFTDYLALQGKHSTEDADIEKKKCLSGLDSKVQQLVTQLHLHSLVAVVMTGRKGEGHHLNAATFLKMT